MQFRSKSTAFLALALLISLGALLTTLYVQSQRHFPWVKVAAQDGIEVQFLLNSQETRNQCVALAANVASAMQSTCHACKVLEQACLDSLTSDQERYFAPEVLSIPVAHMRNGIIGFSAPLPDAALAACQGAERAAGADRVTCYPPSSTRPAPLRKDNITTLLGILASASVWASVSSALLVAIAYSFYFRHAAAMSASLLKWPRRHKQILIFLADIFFIEFALWAAFALRQDSVYVPLDQVLPLLLLAPFVAFPVFVSFGLYRAIVRHLGLQALLAISKAVAVYCVALAVSVYILGITGIPRSVILLHGILTLVLVGTSRTTARYWLRYSESASQTAFARKNVVIYGAGSAGIQLATALAHSREFRPVAFVDDDTGLHHHRLGAQEVYSPDKLPHLIDRFAVREVLLAIPSASRRRRNQIIANLEPLPVHVRTLPGMAELAEGKVKTADLREIDIEDLLGRDPVAPVSELLKANITGKSVMVTGAGGSIGSELCRQIFDQRPAILVLFELNEFALYSIEQDLLNRSKSLPGGATRVLPILGSVTDQARLERVVEQFKIETIYHAAAYKHVPMVEKNPCEGVANNIFGTYRAALAALNQKVETFVLISTDKAVRPTNTMGTTKRFAEMILQALAERNPESTRFTMVRFGNVLGSSGSVVPLFREQIRRGGPITVTDPRIIRYFMTIPEAAQLVIQAGAMGKDGDVFVLDMGEPVKIVDLATRMIHLSGLSVRDKNNPSGDIEIIFSGLRPGEKLYEELLIGDNVSDTNHPRIMRANEIMLPLRTIEAFVAKLITACQEGDSNTARRLLLEAVEDFGPQCENQDLLNCPEQTVAER